MLYSDIDLLSFVQGEANYGPRCPSSPRRQSYINKATSPLYHF